MKSRDRKVASTSVKVVKMIFVDLFGSLRLPWHEKHSIYFHVDAGGDCN